MGTSRRGAATPHHRRGWDSNPRYPYEYNSLAGSPIRPLSHLSRACVPEPKRWRRLKGYTDSGGTGWPLDAEREGFEPPELVTQRFSRPPPSTTRTPLRGVHATRATKYRRPPPGCQIPPRPRGREGRRGRSRTAPMAARTVSTAKRSYCSLRPRRSVTRRKPASMRPGASRASSPASFQSKPLAYAAPDPRTAGGPVAVAASDDVHERRLWEGIQCRAGGAGCWRRPLAWS